MKTTLEILGLLLLMAMIAVLGTWVLQSAAVGATRGPAAVPASPAVESSSQSVNTPSAEEALPARPTSALGYRNETYGFQVLLPDTWDGYRVTVHTHKDTPAVCFWFDRGQPTTVFQVHVYTHEQWARLQALADYELPEVLAETEESVYCYSKGLIADEDPFLLDRVQEVPTIVESLTPTR